MKIRLDPRQSLAYLPATLSDTARVTAWQIELSRLFWPGLHLERTLTQALASLRPLASESRHGGWPTDAQPAVVHGTAHKEVRRTVQSLPEPPASAAPLGPVDFGGFFCVLTAR